MRRLLLYFFGLLAVTTSSCAFASLLTVNSKDLIDQTMSCPTGDQAKAEGFKILGTQAWSQGVIVLYSALCPVATSNEKATMLPVFGHKVVKRSGSTWQVSGSGSYRTEPESLPSERLVEYGISRSSIATTSTTTALQPGELYTILYGRVLQPKVAAVEATFDNGKIVRGKTNNSVFALLSAGATGVCELRVLGADNQILQQEDLVVPKPLAPKEPSVRCLPMSHQL